MSEREEFHGNSNDVNHESARRTRRSFVVGAAASAAGYGLWRAIGSSKQEGRQPEALRRTFQTDAEVSRTVFDERGLSPTYPISDAKPLRLNGTVGLAEVLHTPGWRLQLAGLANPEKYPQYKKDVTDWTYTYSGDMQPSPQSTDVKAAPGNGDKTKTGAPDAQKPAGTPDAGATATPAAANSLNPTGATNSAAGDAIAAKFAAAAAAAEADSRKTQKKRVIGDDEAGASASGLDIGTPGLQLTLDDILKFPSVEFVTQFKCIEGWSNITQWAGVRLRDLLEAYPPAQVNGRDPRYVYMETPDGNYYCGYDLSACRHPQSLLVTHMGGVPLTQEHGAPLRLHMPIKYGYKQLKRIGVIAYMDVKPDDYWEKLGYDWYAGL